MTIAASRRAAAMLAGALLLGSLTGCSGNDATDASPVPTTTSAVETSTTAAAPVVSVDDVCQLLATEAEPGRFSGAPTDPPTTTVGSVLASTSRFLMPVGVIEPPSTAALSLGVEHVHHLTDAEDLAGGTPGITVVETLDSTEFTRHLQAEVGAYPQLVAQLTGPFGARVLVAGDAAAIARLQRAAEEQFEFAIVETAEQIAQIAGLSARAFSSGIQGSSDVLGRIAGSSTDIADHAQALLNAAPSDQMPNLELARAPMDALLAFTSGTCGVQLFRLATDPPQTVDPASWHLQLDAVITAWAGVVSEQFLPAVIEDNALPPDGTGPDWAALAAACGTLGELLVDVGEAIVDAPESVDPVRERLRAFGDLHRRVVASCNAAVRDEDLDELREMIDGAIEIEAIRDDLRNDVDELLPA